MINGFDNNPLIVYNTTDKVTPKGGVYMANQVGKRYRCAKCGAEVIVTKGGTGAITHCGQPMEQKK